MNNIKTSLLFLLGLLFALTPASAYAHSGLMLDGPARADSSFVNAGFEDATLLSIRNARRGYSVSRDPCCNIFKDSFSFQFYQLDPASGEDISDVPTGYISEVDEELLPDINPNANDQHYAREYVYQGDDHVETIKYYNDGRFSVQEVGNTNMKVFFPSDYDSTTTDLPANKTFTIYDIYPEFPSDVPEGFTKYDHVRFTSSYQNKYLNLYDDEREDQEEAYQQTGLRPLNYLR